MRDSGETENKHYSRRGKSQGFNVSAWVTPEEAINSFSSAATTVNKCWDLPEYSPFREMTSGGLVSWVTSASRLKHNYLQRGETKGIYEWECARIWTKPPLGEKHWTHRTIMVNYLNQRFAGVCDSGGGVGVAVIIVSSTCLYCWKACEKSLSLSCASVLQEPEMKWNTLFSMSCFGDKSLCSHEMMMTKWETLVSDM